MSQGDNNRRSVWRTACSRLQQMLLIAALLLVDALVVKFRNKDGSTTVRHKKRVPFSSSCSHGAAIQKLHLPRASRLMNVVEGPGLEDWHNNKKEQNDHPLALCKFRTASDIPTELPNIMQQLFRCFAWWHANPQSQPILIASPSTDSPYVAEFLQVLRKTFHVQMVEKRPPGTRAVRPRIEFDNDDSRLSGFKMRSPADLAHLRDTIVGSTRHGCQRDKELPNVTLVASSPNAEELAQVLRAEIGLIVTTVDEQGEEPIALMSQVSRMQQTDILVGPHGDYLVNIPFLPTCGQVIEFTTKHPRLYASLAAMSSHGYHHVSYNSNSQRRLNERDNDEMCLTTDTVYDQIIPIIREIVQDWQSCCRHQL